MVDISHRNISHTSPPPAATTRHRAGQHGDPYSDWEFNDLAALAARICGARWGLVTLLDPAEQCSPLVLAYANLLPA